VRGEADPRLEMVAAYHTASTLAAINFYNKKNILYADATTRDKLVS